MATYQTATSCVSRKGAGSDNVFPMSHGKDLFDGRELSNHDLINRLRRSLDGAEIRQPRNTIGEPRPLRLLVEEFVKTPDGDIELPWNYKIWMVREHVAAVQVVLIHRRNADKGPKPRPSAFFDENWQLHPSSFYAGGTLAEGLERPECFEEMIDIAQRLAVECDTFMRVDLYASDRGPLFGEFTATPHVGANYSDYAERYMGKLWRELIPDRI